MNQKVSLNHLDRCLIKESASDLYVWNSLQDIKLKKNKVQKNTDNILVQAVGKKTSSNILT